MKNYSRALTNFALSNLATPYLEEIVKKMGVSVEVFKGFIGNNKRKLNCMRNLRDGLLVSDNDSVSTTALKRVFQAICVVFLKEFCANWLFSSKIEDKLTHLSYRFKILRRVRNPEYFTYLESFACQ
jgi:hypothetical protein